MMDKEEAHFDILCHRIASLVGEEDRKLKIPTPIQVIDSIKTIKVTSSMLQDPAFKYSDCSVCLRDLRLDETIQQMPCGHLFHVRCFIPWLVESDSCPLCRHKLVLPPAVSRRWINPQRQLARPAALHLQMLQHRRVRRRVLGRSKRSVQQPSRHVFKKTLRKHSQKSAA